MLVVAVAGRFAERGHFGVVGREVGIVAVETVREANNKRGILIKCQTHIKYSQKREKDRILYIIFKIDLNTNISRSNLPVRFTVIPDHRSILAHRCIIGNLLFARENRRVGLSPYQTGRVVQPKTVVAVMMVVVVGQFHCDTQAIICV